MLTLLKIVMWQCQRLKKMLIPQLLIVIICIGILNTINRVICY